MRLRTQHPLQNGTGSSGYPVPSQGGSRHQESPIARRVRIERQPSAELLEHNDPNRELIGTPVEFVAFRRLQLLRREISTGAGSMIGAGGCERDEALMPPDAHVEEHEGPV